ncbi:MULTISPECIES: hypothetical protein [Thermocrispum]|jgi:hypothetical protein|uniref:Transcriptional regulator n=1 Tax=Thermocrispum agreste TaxID=37925 RepID=A0A2W4LLK7_9PSEU|nr:MULTISPECIES: hypothetical protein [Thermocrispum]PZM96596.1 MAG: transcriptional regulator [Thermocrispum agreste]
MTHDPGVEALIRQWSQERDESEEDAEIARIKSEWLAEASSHEPGIPGQRTSTGTAEWAIVESADYDYMQAMRKRLPGVPDELLAAAARWWQMVGGLAEAEEWWDAGISPLDQRALEYRAAGLTPADLSVHLGPYTVLEHLRRGSAAAWCVARLSRVRKDSTSCARKDVAS